ncbi:hypothetical protein E4U19_006034 [Claviceps sp. Clav32 group G5]|nr:hypothetical protein E4U19_006034 [Claviceps sp. Clav32 group G5]
MNDDRTGQSGGAPHGRLEWRGTRDLGFYARAQQDRNGESTNKIPLGQGHDKENKERHELALPL